MSENASDKRLPEGGSPLQWVQNGVFPDEWTLIPVAGKATYVPEWGSKKRSRVDAEALYQADSRSSGFGVVTGELSGGLLAVDIDGPRADERFRRAVGDGYEAFGEESTMSWTSGKEGRRQILYRVPQHMVRNLGHVTTVILQEAGEWELGKGDVDRNKGEEQYQEVVLRFNRCQSVLPRSIHPDTKGRYRFLNYNGGKPAEAPEWLLEILRGFQKAQAWLSDNQMAEVRKHVDLGDTLLPERQIRGWFFGEDVQRALMPRLEDLVFKHRTFDEYGWRSREGKNAQRMSGCPWHGGESGTAFQYGVDHGCWDCKACGVGGDVLDFIHKVESGDKHADRPRGKDLETYVARIAGDLGFRYPEDANVQVTKEASGLRLGRRELLAEAKKLIKEIRNPAEQELALMDLADRSGLYRMRASDLRNLAIRDSLYNATAEHGLEMPVGWTGKVDLEDFIIPGLLRRPAQVMLHARGGVGKSEMALALAKAVGRGETLQVRGMDVPIEQGKVLWFSNDQGNSRLASMLEQQGIEEAGRDKDWFRLICGWKLDMLAELKELITKHKPVVCVMDSLGTIMEDIAKENEGDYAKWIYQLTSLNGDLNKELGFPSTAFIWIHHNTKSNTSFRGSDRLLNAMEETWELRELTEEEEAELGVNRRILTVGKSRFNRSGDRLIVHRDLEFNFSISDMTPLIQKEGVNRTGDSTPETLVLALLARSEKPLTKEELREALHERMRGEGRPEKDLPSEWGVRKYLKLWLAEGLVEEVKLPSTGGRPKVGYRSRGKDKFLSHRKYEIDPEQLRRNGFGGGKGAHRKSPSEDELTESPETVLGKGSEGCSDQIGSTLSSDRLSVSSAENAAPHRKSSPENACVASDLVDTPLSVDPNFSFNRAPDELRANAADRSPRQSPLLPSVDATGAAGGSRARASERGADRGTDHQVPQGVRLAHPGLEAEVPPVDGGSAQAAGHGPASGDSGVGLAEPGDQSGVREVHAELAEGRAVGGQVPGGQDDLRQAPSFDEPVEGGSGITPDRAAVPQQTRAQTGEPQGLVGAGTGVKEGEDHQAVDGVSEAGFYDPTWDDFDTAFG